MGVFSKKKAKAPKASAPAQEGFVKLRLTNGSNADGWKINGADTVYFSVNGVIEVPAAIAEVLSADKDYEVVG